MKYPQKPLYIFSNNFNSCPQSEMFPGKLKLPEAVSVYEKTNKKGKSNYRPISILSTISKIYERCIQTQLNGHTKLNFVSFLSKFLCGFQQGLSFGNDRKTFRSVITDLSKAFECIPFQLLIAKLSAYSFVMKSIAFISRTSKKRKQITKFGSNFSKCLDILFGVAQGSILGPLLCLIFIADLLYLNCDLNFTSYADDIIPCICGHVFSSIIKVLEPNVYKFFNWFRQNGLIVNSDRSHFLTSSYERRSLKIHDSVITSTSSEELLGFSLIMN